MSVKKNVTIKTNKCIDDSTFISTTTITTSSTTTTPAAVAAAAATITTTTKPQADLRCNEGAKFNNKKGYNYLCIFSHILFHM
jgi:hypothetical protein